MALCLPKRKVSPLQKKERELIAAVRGLLDRLDHATDVCELRGLLADAISRVHQVPLNRVLDLATDEVQVVADEVTLWPASLQVS